MTTERKKYVKYVSLNILAMLGSSCYIVADTFFIANGVGADGLTALNFGIAMFSFMQALALLTAIGSGTRYAICVSRGDLEKGSRVFKTALMLGISIGVLISLGVNLFAEPIASALGADEVTMPLTIVYIRTVMSCSVFFICNQIIVAFIRNDHNPKLATMALLISNFSNIVLDYVFIFPFGWGMFGAALATGMAPAISLVILSFHFMQKKNHFHFKGALLGLREVLGFLKLGVSAMVNELSVGLVVMIFNFLFLGLGGNTAVAAYGIVANVALFAIAIYTGVSQGIQPLVSDYYGRGEAEHLRQVRRDTIFVAAGISVILVIVAFAFNPQIVSFFNESGDPALAAMAEEGMKFYFVSFIFAGFNITLAGYLSAMERADFGFLISLLRGLLVVAPAALILSRIFGTTGIWMAVVVTEVITFCATMIMVRKAAAAQQ